MTNLITHKLIRLIAAITLVPWVVFVVLHTMPQWAYFTYIKLDWAETIWKYSGVWVKYLCGPIDVIVLIIYFRSSDKKKVSDTALALLLTGLGLIFYFFLFIILIGLLTSPKIGG